MAKKSTKGKKQQKSYNTHLASEFYVMSTVHRLGLDAYLTLGNKKGVDILVKGKKNSTVKIEVKGVASKTDDWPVGKIEAENVFYVLISFEGTIEKVDNAPHVWVLPSKLLNEKAKTSKTKTGKDMKYVSHKMVRENLEEYRDAWHLITSQLA